MAFSFTPSTANSIDVIIGIQNTLSNYILQNETITETAQTLEIPDQKGRVAQVIAYDKQFNCRLTAIGPDTAPAAVGATFNWKDVSGTSIDYIVQTCEKAATYNDTAKWNLTLIAYAHASYSDKTDSAL